MRTRDLAGTWAGTPFDQKGRPTGGHTVTSTFNARLRTPAQELHLKVRPARDGVRLDLDGRHLFLTERVALEVANALADATEASTTAEDPE